MIYLLFPLTNSSVSICGDLVAIIVGLWRLLSTPPYRNTIIAPKTPFTINVN
jgi:hypothetical protein